MATPKSLKLKLSLKKETLRELNDSQLGVLDQVVGGTESPPPPPTMSANCCNQTVVDAN